MLTEKDYCDYDTCVALKELGYKVPTSAYYISNDTTLYFVSNPFRGGYAIDCFYSHNSLREGVVTSNYIDAPTMWEAQKWLREEKDIDIIINIIFTDEDKEYYGSIFSPRLNKPIITKCWSSYYKVFHETIKAAVKLLKEERK